MRNASESSNIAADSEAATQRATFEAPRALIAEFRALAAKRERTLSAELRKLMSDELEREAA